MSAATASWSRPAAPCSSSSAESRSPPTAGSSRISASSSKRQPLLHRLDRMERREVVFVDGVRTAFGRAGAQGLFWKTRADDMAVKVVRELLRRQPELAPVRIGDGIFAASPEVGAQGVTLG